MKSAATSITAAIGTSHQASTAKITNGAQAAMMSCGRYAPKKVCNCSTPSMTDSITPPVRSVAEPRRAERGDAVEQTRPQGCLYPPGRVLGQHGARVIESGTDQHAGRRRRGCGCDRSQGRARESQRQDAAQADEAQDADNHRSQAKPNRSGHAQP